MPSSKQGVESFIPLILHKFLHIVDMTHWLLPFANRTEMEKARKAANPAVLKQILTALKNEMLNEHTRPQARTQLKEASSAYILQHYPQTSAPGKSYSKSKVATPLGSPSFPSKFRLHLHLPMGLVEPESDGGCCV
jgi:hypothetical protein